MSVPSTYKAAVVKEKGKVGTVLCSRCIALHCRAVVTICSTLRISLSESAMLCHALTYSTCAAAHDHAFVFTQPFVLEERNIPSLKRNQVLLKVLANGVCHSDLRTYYVTHPAVQSPRVPGHEV